MRATQPRAFLSLFVVLLLAALSAGSAAQTPTADAPEVRLQALHVVRVFNTAEARFGQTRFASFEEIVRSGTPVRGSETLSQRELGGCEPRVAGADSGLATETRGGSRRPKLQALADRKEQSLPVRLFQRRSGDHLPRQGHRLPGGLARGPEIDGTVGTRRQ